MPPPPAPRMALSDPGARPGRTRSRGAGTTRGAGLEGARPSLPFESRIRHRRPLVPGEVLVEGLREPARPLEDEIVDREVAGAGGARARLEDDAVHVAEVDPQRAARRPDPEPGRHRDWPVAEARAPRPRPRCPAVPRDHHPRDVTLAAESAAHGRVPHG